MYIIYDDHEHDYPCVDSLIDDKILNEYIQNGFWVAPIAFKNGYILRLKKAQDRIWAEDNDSEIPSQYGLPKIKDDLNSIRQLCNGFWINDEIKNLITNPFLGLIASKLMGVESVQVWHDQVIYKPGLGCESESTSGNVGWHQDAGHWKCVDSSKNMCTAWIALQNINKDIGPLTMIRGSNKWGLLENSDTFGEKNLDQLEKNFSHQVNEKWIAEHCLLKAGQVSFHHSLTLHGSGPNTTNVPRMSNVIHYMEKGSKYLKDVDWHPNLVFLGPNAKDGDVFEGEFWPQVWPINGENIDDN